MSETCPTCHQPWPSHDARFCAFCKSVMKRKRYHAKYCSDSCRAKASQVRNGKVVKQTEISERGQRTGDSAGV